MAPPTTASNRKSLVPLSELSNATPRIWWGIQLGELDSHPIPPPSIHGGEGSSFPGWVLLKEPVDTESVVGMKPSDSGVLIGYQVNQCTHTWSTECFVGHLHVYPGLMGKVSTLTQFPPELECEDYCFLDQAVVDFEQDLDSIFIDFGETPKLNA